VIATGSLSDVSRGIALAVGDDVHKNLRVMSWSTAILRLPARWRFDWDDAAAIVSN
jgi:hypothetical protein